MKFGGKTLNNFKGLLVAAVGIEALVWGLQLPCENPYDWLSRSCSQRVGVLISVPFQCQSIYQLMTLKLDRIENNTCKHLETLIVFTNKWSYVRTTIVKPWWLTLTGVDEKALVWPIVNTIAIIMPTYLVNYETFRLNYGTYNKIMEMLMSDIE